MTNLLREAEEEIKNMLEEFPSDKSEYTILKTYTK